MPLTRQDFLKLAALGAFSLTRLACSSSDMKSDEPQVSAGTPQGSRPDLAGTPTPRPSATATPAPTNTAPKSTATPTRVPPRIVYTTIEPGLDDDGGMHNPLRGPYKWRDDPVEKQIPTGGRPYLAYERFDWSALEPAPGDYDFAAIDTQIAAARANGQRFWFCIRCMHEEHGDSTYYLPEYLPHWRRRDGTPIPDFNHPKLLRAWENLYRELDRRYANDTTVIGHDIGGFGTWGEWSLSDSIYSEAPQGIVYPTDAALIEMVDSMTKNAFTHKWAVQNIKDDRHIAAIVSSLRRRLTGWRTNGVAGGGAREWTDILDFDTKPVYAATYAAMKDKWLSVPTLAEFFSPFKRVRYEEAVAQVTKWHIDTIGNGNLLDWNSYPDHIRQALKETMLSAGYRYRIARLLVPSPFVAGHISQVSTRWQNIGSAPIHEDVSVTFKLSHPISGLTIGSWVSSVDLKLIISERTHTDAVNIPADLPSGSYQLRVVVKHPQTPLALANKDRQPDGSYLLGGVTVY